MVHRFEDPKHWAKVFEGPARDAWQKPKELVKRLEDTVEAMKRRNDAIEAAAARYEDGATWLDKRRDALRAETAYLKADGRVQAAGLAMTSPDDDAAECIVAQVKKARFGWPGKDAKLSFSL